MQPILLTLDSDKAAISLVVVSHLILFVCVNTSTGRIVCLNYSRTIPWRLQDGGETCKLCSRSTLQKQSAYDIRSEPSNRGSFRLLVSCITTLVLCVYTAVHLNVPKQGTTKFQLYAGKAGIVILGILAREITVYMACIQWNSARILTARIKRLLDEKVIE